MMTILAAWGPWLWLGLSVLLISLEVMVPGLHFIWFGIGAGLVALAAFAGLGGFEWQLALFGLLSLGALYAGRSMSGRSSGPTDPDAAALNERGHQYIGRNAVVAEPIVNGRGKIKIGDTLWLAEGPDMPAGTRVTVSSTHGTVLVVERAGIGA